jgi:hypothetical protein
MTPNSDSRGVETTFSHSIKWPDRSHRTLAEVWKISAEDVNNARKEGGRGAN